ncbi:CNH domain-domain-containing protein [Aspergillus taichungensis]|uniref:CNH domain-domain-containing protein n=1 Tax=Aspergillus taichungensis TaxID=482145 RepID=A0A2J5HR65_9EURO|nr:CNH domain-domain-containing protein [Aspergillus taichungensis]
MAHYREGPYQEGPYQNGHYQNGSPNGYPSLRRMPSYNEGDDAELQLPRPGGGYGPRSPPRVRPRASTHAPVYQHPSSSSSSHHYQYTASAASSSSPYNPQQYPTPTATPTSLGYSPLAYTGPTHHHPPYNPAAYQATGAPTFLSRPSSLPYPQTPLSPTQPLPPPPPPRGPDHPYGGRGVYGISPPPITPRSAAVPMTYGPQSPRWAEHAIEDHPPPPPVHAAPVEDPAAKRGPLPRVGSGRALPTPPLPPRRTDTLTRHPQARPLPGPPVAEDRDGGPPPAAYDDLMREVEAAVQESRGASDDHSNHDDGTLADLAPDEMHTHTNGSISTGTGQYVNYDAYSDESDAEAAAGVAMMQMADEEDRALAERRARRDTDAATPASLRSAHGSHSSGHAAGPAGAGAGGTGASADSDDSDYYDYPTEPPAFFPAFTPPHARVDTDGTGGLTVPTTYGRRAGDRPTDEAHDQEEEEDEEEDEEEEAAWSPAGSAGAASDAGDSGPAELFFHPGMRPLPPAPVEPAPGMLPHLVPAGTYRRPLPVDPPPLIVATGEAGDVPSPSQVPRSSSLSTHPIAPRAETPTRSKTDADRARYKPLPNPQDPTAARHTLPSPEYVAPATPTDAGPAPGPTVGLDLPTIPAGRRKRPNLAKLSSDHFRRCAEPWALSAILAWIRELCEDETDLRQQAVVDALVALFTHKVPTMNVADAETLAARVVTGMRAAGALVPDEEWVKFGPGTLSGVLVPITGTGCYAPRLHDFAPEGTNGRCYAHHCMRTLKKVNLRTQPMAPQEKAADWVTFYRVPKEVWEAHPRKEIDRQNNLHEIVTTEDAFIAQLDVLRELYRDQLRAMQPPLLPAKRLAKFLQDVFGRVDAVKRVNEDHLLAQLKYRQKEQGPFIAGFSDLFREWIRKARAVYVDYAATFPHASYLVRREADRNVAFRAFLGQARDHKRSNRLSWDTYLKAPITRIQRYTLLLTTVHKNMTRDSEEKANLAQAIEEIRLVALDCDHKVGETARKVDLMELGARLQLRPDMRKEVELHLEHLGREVIHRGDLQRPRTRTRFLADCHAILFDHYLVLSKRSRTANYECFDVSKLPIPMDLLALESTSEDPVVKSSVRGVTTVTQAQGLSAGAMAPLVGGGGGGSGGGSSSSSGGHALVPATVLESSKDDKVLYPFKIKHLGVNGSYVLYAASARDRREWCEKIVEAKTRHAAALFAQNAEPFRLRVLADTAFAPSDHSMPTRGVAITGTPLDRAIREVERRYPAGRPRPPPVCRTTVHCATVFEQPAGRRMCAIGTDYGVYLSAYDDPRGWTRAIPIIRVTQITVFEEFNLFLLIADKSLIAYHLDVVCPASGVASQTTADSARRAPQKLSGAREVGFFAAGHMKDRTLVMYKKRDGLSSTFKVLEPVLQKSASSRNRFFTSRRAQTDFFREYDEFYIPAESYGINMFHSSLAISTHRGIEILTMDKKQTWSVPDFRTEAPEAQAQLQSIAQRITGLRPLGMFRLSDSEFLVVYTDCAVYVNKHGDISRSVVMEFVGRANSACLYGRFLLLFDDDFVEVRNAMNGRLRQVIPGHGVVCLDDGSSLPGSGANSIPMPSGGMVNLSSGLSNGPALANSGRTVKISMQHPEYERSLIILELIENEGQKD